MSAIKIGGYLASNDDWLKENQYLGYDNEGYFIQIGHPTDFTVSLNFNISSKDLSHKWNIYKIDEMRENEIKFLTEKIKNSSKASYYWRNLEKNKKEKSKWFSLLVRDFNYYAIVALLFEDEVKLFNLTRYGKIIQFSPYSPSKEWFTVARLFCNNTNYKKFNCAYGVGDIEDVNTDPNKYHYLSY